MPTPRFAEALQLANQLHARQRRKGTGVPYIAHLMSVSALVFEDGGDEDEAIAGLLHDAVEDQGGAATLAEIRRRFGDRVADIVDACSDTDVIPKPPWRERKERYLGHLATAPPEVRRVSAADKVHNARSIVTDYRQQGEAFWGRFTAGREGTLWYYRAVLDTLLAHGRTPLVDELERVVREMEALVGLSI